MLAFREPAYMAKIGEKSYCNESIKDSAVLNWLKFG